MEVLMLNIEVLVLINFNPGAPNLGQIVTGEK